MSCLGPDYNPNPPRAWSRVDVPCVYNNVSNSPSQFNKIFLPFLNKSVFAAEAPFQVAMYNKGNILQYKKNSSSLTKNQRYSQISKGLWVNRTTTWASQTQTYTNPNTQYLQRVGSNPINLQTGGTPTITQLTCPSPSLQSIFQGVYTQQIATTSNDTIQNGGNLVCNTFENPCTNTIIVKPTRSPCNPSSNSDVPGRSIYLCWNDGTQTWYPRQRYFNNSAGGNKFPQGYKGLVSANGIISVS
jgi:hypothetical protein